MLCSRCTRTGISCIKYDDHDCVSSNFGYLKSIAVKSGWRGKKLGEQMMAFIEKEIFSTCANLFLCVSSFNPDAQKFYLKLGYEKIGVLKNYLVEGHDEILMRKTISPILERC